MVRSQATTAVVPRPVAAMTIAQLARDAGVGVETVRYYQRRGLVDTPDRTGGAGPGGGIRRYGRDHVRRLRFIRNAQVAGFTLDEIAELITLDATENRRQASALAWRRLAALDARIAELTAARGALARLAKDCAEGAAGPCPIIEAFERGG